MIYLTIISLFVATYFLVSGYSMFKNKTFRVYGDFLNLTLKGRFAQLCGGILIATGLLFSLVTFLITYQLLGLILNDF